MKKQMSKRLTALLLAFAICLSYVVPAGAVEPASRSLAFEQVDNSAVSSSIPADRVVQEKEEAPFYKETDSVRVSIVLEDASTLEAGFSAISFAENELAVAYREELRAEQETMTNKISKTALKGKELDVVWNLTLAANIISANVNYGDIEKIKAVKGVADVLIETRYEPDVVSAETADPNMATSSEMIGSGIAYAEGYYGEGSKIAVIDTGTDTDHKSFNSEAFLHAVSDDTDLMTADDIAAVLDQLNIASAGVTAEELYVNEKLPYGYNYVDGDLDITHDKDTQGEHGSHVAGIATANRYINNGDGTFTEALTAVNTQGVAPDAQLITMKVFGKGGGAYDSDYMAAIEDAIVLGADSINLSLGSGNPGMSNPSDAKYQAILDSLTEAGAVVCISAGNSGTWQENTTYGYLYNDGVSMQTDGSPGSYTNSLAVASVDNTGNTGNFLDFGEGLEAVSFNETSGYTNVPLATLDTTGEGTEYDFVLFNNTGKDGSGNNLLTDYADVCKDKVVMVYRGTSSFFEKHDAVGEVGGAACIVVNNQAGTINMDLSSSTATIPCVSIQQAVGEVLKTTATAVTDEAGNILYYTGKVVISKAVKSVQGYPEYYTMSSFSSWGIPGSLEMKPEITAPGGNIYSVNGAVAGGEAYENMSGTSMASPQMAGMAAVVAEYIRENNLTEKTGLSARQLAQSLLMSTAEPIKEGDSRNYYSVLTQGAGVANVGAAVKANSYVTMADDANSGATDGKVKVELGDDPAKTGVYSFTYTLHNLTDSTSYFDLNTDVFTQDVFVAETYSGVETLLDTWTITLADAKVSYTVNGVQVKNESAAVAGLTTDDAQAVLDYAAGNLKLTDNQLAAYDVDGDGSVTTYDAHLILNAQDGAVIAVPANGETTVTVTIDVTDCDFTYYPTGAYIEAYSYATEWSTEEGEEGTTHSIPVLGYYGNWSDPSMYDVGTLAEYWYETETRYPYLINETELFTNYLTVKYPNDSGEYYYFGNPLTDDDEYLPERNAFNSDGSLNKYYATIIRNAGNAIWQVTDAKTGEVYARQELGTASSAYYYANGSAWRNTQSSVSLGWQGTDAQGNKLPEGTEVNVSLVLAPEYYASEDGTYDWDALTDGVLGKGAYMTTRTTIDNTAPEMTELAYDPQTKVLSVTAADNRYLATVAVYANGVEKELSFVAPNQALEDLGKSASYEIDLSANENTELYVQVTDYAMNQSTYKFVLTEDGVSDEKVAPTKITLPETATVVKGTTIQLTPELEPWLAKNDITWSSDNEEIATVDANGVVTGVSVGVANITATSAENAEISATCAVTVKSYDVTLTGALQDKDGNPQIFTWNLETDKTWKKTVDLDNNINAITFDFAHENGAMFQMDTSGYLHKVDVTTGETLENSAAAVEFGAPVDDMEYAGLSSLNMEQDVLVGVYGTYFLYSIPGMDNTFSYGWNMAGYLSNYLGASSFTAVAWAGYTTNTAGNRVDVFYCLTDTGDIWVMMPDFTTGSAGLNYYETDLELDFPGYDSAYYCSMVMGDDGNFYLSYFNGSTNQIYVLEGEDIYQDGEYYDTVYHATLLGDVGDAVWPAGLLTVTPNKTEGEDEVDPDKFDNVQWIEVAETAQQITLPTKTESTGGLNAVNTSLYVTETAKVEKVTPVETGRVYMDLYAENTTNGLTTLTFDPEVLEFVSLDADCYYSVSYDGNGKLAVAYAAPAPMTTAFATVTFRYVKGDGNENAKVTVTTVEENDNFEPTTEVVTLTTNGHTHDYKATVTKATCTTMGYTTYTCACGDSYKSDYVDVVKCPSADYTDVDTKLWYHEAVDYVLSNKLMNGTGATTFEPDETTNRAMVATVLYRAAGEPDVTGLKNVFSDVKESDWFYKAVLWASNEGIVKGMDNGTFAPTDVITREQMATMLWRCAGEPEADAAVLKAYTDEAKISDYAKQAFAWAVSEGIINGMTTTTIDPQGTATRAQVATIVMRFLEK